MDSLGPEPWAAAGRGQHDAARAARAAAEAASAAAAAEARANPNVSAEEAAAAAALAALEAAMGADRAGDAFCVEAWIAPTYALTVAVDPNKTVRALREVVEDAFCRTFGFDALPVFALQDPNHNDLPPLCKLSLCLQNGDRVYVHLHREAYSRISGITSPVNGAHQVEVPPSPSTRLASQIHNRYGGRIAECFRSYFDMRERLLRPNTVIRIKAAAAAAAASSAPAPAPGSSASSLASASLSSSSASLAPSTPLAAATGRPPASPARPAGLQTSSLMRATSPAPASSPFSRNDAEIVLERVQRILQSPCNARHRESVRSCKRAAEADELVRRLDALPAEDRVLLPQIGQAVVEELRASTPKRRRTGQPRAFTFDAPASSSRPLQAVPEVRAGSLVAPPRDAGQRSDASASGGSVTSPELASLAAGTGAAAASQGDSINV